MTVTRISNFDIESRLMFSGIYGPGMDDVFLGSDLHYHDVYEMLYRSLRGEGYFVVFYSQDVHHHFYSYRKADLAEVYGLSASTNNAATASGGRYIAKIASPFGKRRTSQAPRAGNHAPEPGPDYAQIQKVEDGAHTYYRISDSIDPFSVIDTYIKRRPHVRTAFVFATASSDRYENGDQYESTFELWANKFNTQGYGTRIVLLYSVAQVKGLFNNTSFFRREKFREMLKGTDEESGGVPTQLYYLSGPSFDEYRNLFNRRSLFEGMTEVLEGIGIEKLSSRMAQITTPAKKGKTALPGDEEKLKHYRAMEKGQFLKMIDKFTTGSAMERLRALCGMEGVVTQIENYLENFEYARANPDGPRFRPHLVFVGNPGTGKTTVARLLAEILQERGLLSRGHLIEATVGDLEGQYVGETRIKTQAICDRAAGGVLFIDEAYGLMSDASGHGTNVDYGKQAIEVLIQFMESRTDSLVILAGYPGQMENLLLNGNEGLAGRFNGEDSFIRMADYPPEVLYKIFRKNLGKTAITEQFDSDIHQVITNMYMRRDGSWRNAATMEVLAGAVLAQHRRRRAVGPVDIEDIPERYMKTIAREVPVDEILADINKLIGLPEVKAKLRQLVITTTEKRCLNKEVELVDTEKKNMYYAFTGNPGTGKTTVALMMAKILYNIGLISQPETVILTIDKLGTSDAIQKIVRDNCGKVLFIDEAYRLNGTEAINELCDCFDKTLGKQALIIAGYTRELSMFIGQNIGLSSRFTDKNIFHFEDYSPDILWNIVVDTIEKKKINFAEPEAAKKLGEAYFVERRRVRGEHFGNVRDARAFANVLIDSLLLRRNANGSSSKTIELVDFPNYRPTVQNPASQEKAAPKPRKLEDAIPGVVSLSLPLPSHSRAVGDVEHFDDAVGLVETPDGVGTGCFISVDGGLILTAAHVVAGHDKFRFLRHRRQSAVGATLLWIDHVTDLAILKAETVPADARHFSIDTAVDVEPRKTEPIRLCGYMKGMKITDDFHITSGEVSSYDPAHRVNETNVFDAIFSDISAIEGCSGGPLLRISDHTIIGTLFGGSTEAPLRIFSDIHQLFKLPSLKISLTPEISQN